MAGIYHSDVVGSALRPRCLSKARAAWHCDAGGTFDNYSTGSGQIGADSEVRTTFAVLTAGLLTQAQNIADIKRISDIAVSAAR